MSANSDIHREEILSAAIHEFGRVGYAAASTNEIVKNAKVSKGLLFHHFTNKEKLYTECQLYVLEQYANFMLENLELKDNEDIFDRILHSLRMKIAFGCKNPEYLALMNRAWHLKDENPLELSNAINHVMERTGMKMAGIFDGVDISRFREGIVLEKIVDYARLALEASWTRFVHRHHNDGDAMVEDMDSYFAEAEGFIDLFRNGAYA